jgi:hypothetical protein
MAQPTTTTELATYTEREIGHLMSSGTSSSQRDDIIGHLDRANKIIAGGGGILNYDDNGNRRKDDQVFIWDVAENPKIINLSAPYTSGFTVTATQDSTSVTLSADPSSGGDLSDWHIQIGNESEVYRIASHTGTSVTLDSNYVQSNTSGASAKIFKLLYTVGSSDILKPLNPLRSHSDKDRGGVIPIVGKDELLTQHPLSDVKEIFPTCAAITKYTSGTLTLQFSDYSPERERLTLDYIGIPSTLVADSVNPTMPEQFRLTLAHLAAYFLLHRLDDDRWKTHLGMARDLYHEMTEYNRQIMSSGDPMYGRIVPVVGSNELDWEVNWRGEIS